MIRLFSHTLVATKINFMGALSTSKGPGPSFTKGRKYCRRRRRRRRLYVGIYVRVESVLLKAVSSVVNVDVNVDFRATYDWSFSLEFV